MNGAEALMHSQEVHGVQHMFGTCGRMPLPRHDAVRTLDPDSKHVLMQDARNATCMTDSHTRVTEGIGVREGDLPIFGSTVKDADIKERKFAKFQTLAQSQADPIIPEQIIDTLNKNLPDDAFVVSDPGTSYLFYNAYSQQKNPCRQYITNSAHGAFGLSLSAALGALLDHPQCKVVAMMGDGCLASACRELDAALHSDAPITFFACSNSSFDRANRASVAEAFGLKSWQVEKAEDLNAVMKEALEQDGPTLIDVVCQPLAKIAAPCAVLDGGAA